MRNVEQRATERRMEMHALFKQAGVPATILYRWRSGQGIPTLPTIGKLETTLAKIEATPCST